MKKSSLLRVTYAQAVHGREEEKRVLSVLKEHRTIMGTEIMEFEKRVAKINSKKFGTINSKSKRKGKQYK